MVSSYTVSIILRKNIFNFNSGFNRVCFSTVSDTGYSGTWNITPTGRTCQRWDSNSPHTHANSVTDIPESTFTDAENYCRNPDEGYGLWCYTTDPAMRFEYCDIWRCLPDNSKLFTHTHI